MSQIMESAAPKSYQASQEEANACGSIAVICTYSLLAASRECDSFGAPNLVANYTLRDVEGATPVFVVAGEEIHVEQELSDST